MKTEQGDEQRAWGAERGRVEVNRRVQASDVRVRELETETERLRQEEGRRAREAEVRQEEEQYFWVLRRAEIQMTEEELGRGGWAVVKVATFRGTQVAAKCLHHLIIS